MHQESQEFLCGFYSYSHLRRDFVQASEKGSEIKVMWDPTPPSPIPPSPPPGLTGLEFRLAMVRS